MAADAIDGRYDEIVRGLRALPGAPADLRGRVLELAATADRPRPHRRGLRITRSLGGFVQSVDYGTPSGGNGDAYLTVRIPVGSVQKAVTRFTALGSIVSQHLSIRDLQNQANAETLRILQLRELAAQLRAKLSGQLTPEERVAVQARLDAVRGQLRAKAGQLEGTLRQGRLS